MINFPELSPIDEVNYEIAVINNNIAIATTQYNETGCGLEKCKLMMQIIDLENEREDAIEYRNNLKATSCQSCACDNELNVFGAQIEYQQDEIDYLQDELADAEEAIDYWVGEADRNSTAQSDYDNLLSIFKALQIDYHNLEKTLFNERAGFDKANDLLHDDIIDLQMKLRETEQRLADTSERAADYWKRLKAMEGL